MGRHVETLVEQLGEDGTAWLPPHVRACLLVAARRRGVLSCRLLGQLLDDSSTSLDVSGCSALTDRAVQQALARLPHLRALDVSRCDQLTAGTLHAAARLCPRLRTLRVGGSAAADEVAGRALKTLLPRIEARGEAEGDTQGSWEDLSDTSAPAVGRMANLQYLVWPSITLRARQLVLSLCPRLIVNSQPGSALASTDSGGGSAPAQPRTPGSAAAAAVAACAARPLAAAPTRPSSALDLPVEAHASIPLDEPLAQQVGCAAWEGLGQAGAEGAAAQAAAQEEDDLPLHEKFRRALVGREATVRLREQRSAALWQRRQLRDDVVLRVREGWLDEA